MCMLHKVAKEWRKRMLTGDARNDRNVRKADK